MYVLKKIVQYIVPGNINFKIIEINEIFVWLYITLFITNFSKDIIIYFLKKYLIINREVISFVRKKFNKLSYNRILYNVIKILLWQFSL